jgi:hypothetical protein
MDKSELKKKLDEVKNLILTNSKDAHWTKNALDELLSLKGQLDHEPTIVHTPISKIERTVKGDTFELHEMKDGTAIYHVYGGYTVVVDSRMSALNNAMKEYIALMSDYSNLSEEEQTNVKLSLSAFGYIMSCPLFAFTSEEFTFDMASKIVEFLRESAESLLNEELKDETSEDVELNSRFKDATMALEELKEDINKVANK